MHALFLLLVTAAAVTVTQAQNPTGKVVYESTFSFKSGSVDSAASASGIPAELAAMMPSEQRHKKVLYYSEAASLYENLEDPADNQDYSKGNVKIQIRTETPEEKIFTDLHNQRTVQQKDLMGRVFLVSGELPAHKWKITGRQKQLLDHPCMEAVMGSGEDSVVAWYTTDIPVSTGPEGLGGLPGLILEAAIGKAVTIKALQLQQQDATAAAQIRQPVKGKKISEPAFRELARAKREEMQKEYGGNQQIMFRVIGN